MHKITNKPRTLAQRHVEASNWANTGLCATKVPRKITHNLRTITNELYIVRTIKYMSVVYRCYKRETCIICLLIVSGKSSMNAILATFLQFIADIPCIFHALSK
jgi:hypothetical protein